MEHLAGPQAAQAEVERRRAGDRLPPRLDPALDHQRGGVVGRTPAARVHRQLEVEDRPPRDRRHAEAEEPAAPGVADAGEREASGVGPRGEERQRRPRVDYVQLPGGVAGIVPAPGLAVQSFRECGHEAPPEHRDHVLVRAFPQSRRRDGGGVGVATRGAHPEPAVEASRGRPDEERGGVRRRQVDHSSRELGGASGQVFRRRQGLDRERRPIGRWRVILAEADRAERGRQRADLHGAAGAQLVDPGRHGEPASFGSLDLRVSRRARLHREAASEVRQRHRHGPGAVDRTGHHLGGAGRLERVAGRHRVGVDLEAPEARPHLVEEVDPLAAVGHRRRGAITRDAAECGGVRRRGARRAGVEERVAGDQLAEVPVIGDVEVAEPGVPGVRAVGVEPGQAVHGFGGDDGAHRLPRGVDEVEVVGLPSQVARRRPHHVVGEHRGELRPNCAEGPRHGGVHGAGAEVRAVELVDDPRQVGQLRPQHVGKGVGGAEVVARELVARVQAGGIPAERHALRL